MTRQLKIEFPNAFYHVISRGINRQNLFFDHNDFNFFLYLLSQAKEKYKIKCHSYCLMNNHYHLYIQTTEANLSLVMKFINQCYAEYFLKKYPDKDGHVFKGRYKRKIVQSNLYSLELSRYIHLNPVRASIVKHPHEWQWSSFRSFIGLEKPHYCLETNWLLNQFSSKKEKAQKLMMQYTCNGLDTNWDPEEKSFGKTILGSENFFNYIRELYIDTIDLKYDVLGVSEYKVSQKLDVDFIFSFVEKLDCKQDIKKKLLVYYLREHSNLSLTEIGSLINSSPYAISKTHSRTKSWLKQHKELNHLVNIWNKSIL